MPQLADTTVVHAHVDPAGESYLNRVIIIDGMAVVISITKSKEMKTCQYFADAFLQIICNIAVHYDDIRLVFDRYLDIPK